MARHCGDEVLARASGNYMVCRKEDRPIAGDGAGTQKPQVGLWRVAPQNGNDYLSLLEFDTNHLPEDNRQRRSSFVHGQQSAPTKITLLLLRMSCVPSGFLAVTGTLTSRSLA